MKIIIDRDNKTLLYWQIYNQIREDILQGDLVDGMVLPSERSLASKLGVHRNTIIKAFGLLKDDGYVTSTQGVGYRISYSGGKATAEAAMEEAGNHRKSKKGKESVNWNAAIKDGYFKMESSFDEIYSKQRKENVISLASGMAPMVYSESKIGADIADILGGQKNSPYRVTPYQGDLELRKAIVTFLRNKGINTSVKYIQVLSEMNQALDFIFNTMLNPGDTILVEEPLSPDIYRAAKLSNCKMISVPLDKEGLQCEIIEPLIEKYNPKFILVNGSFHDPTGVKLSKDRREKIIHISKKYRVPIIAEDAASELSFSKNPVPQLKAMDKHENVIYIYSFALSFVPGLSLAFVVAPMPVIKALRYLVSVRVISVDWVSQKLLGKYLDNGVYYNNICKMKEDNYKKMQIVCSYLDTLKSIGVEYNKPEGGVYVWCKLPYKMKSKEVAKEAYKADILIIHGEIFYPSGNGGGNHIRINFSYESESNLRKGMEELCKIIKRMHEEKI